jgi:hypothetical protein
MANICRTCCLAENAEACNFCNFCITFFLHNVRKENAVHAPWNIRRYAPRGPSRDCEAAALVYLAAVRGVEGVAGEGRSCENRLGCESSPLSPVPRR